MKLNNVKLSKQEKIELKYLYMKGVRAIRRREGVVTGLSKDLKVYTLTEGEYSFICEGDASVVVSSLIS